MSKYTIKAGDTLTLLAKLLSIDVATIQVANPGLDPNNLQVGQVINLPGQSTVSYTIVSGDTLNAIASKFGTSVAAVQNSNPGITPTDLQIGQIIHISSPAISVPPNPTSPPPIIPPPLIPSGSTYVIVSGDTFTTIGAKTQINAAAIQAANPGVDPTKLQGGQTINLPSNANIGARGILTPIASTASSVGAPYVTYSGPASAFPPQSSWASYGTLWASNSKLMSYNNIPTQVTLIGQAILSIAAESGIDPRCILCIIMQESGGNLHVGNTSSPDGVNNTGIMQAHNGASFNPANEAGSIRQMIRDGTSGTVSGDGLVQVFRRYGNYYAAFRAYNSGSVDASNLSVAWGATGDYVSKVANRLLGHVWAGM